MPLFSTNQRENEYISLYIYHWDTILCFENKSDTDLDLCVIHIDVLYIDLH